MTAKYAVLCALGESKATGKPLFITICLHLARIWLWTPTSTVSTAEDSYILNQNKRKANVFLRLSLTRCLTLIRLQEATILAFPV